MLDPLLHKARHDLSHVVPQLVVGHAAAHRALEVADGVRAVAHHLLVLPADGRQVGHAVLDGDGPAGRQFNRNNFSFSFALKNGLIFHFDSVTCRNYPFLNFSLV